MDNTKKKKFLVYVAYISVIGALLYFAIRFCLFYLLPFIIGFCIAFAVQKPAEKISKRLKIKKGTAALFTVIGIYILMILLVFLLGNRIFAFISDFTLEAPKHFEKITASVKGVIEKIINASAEFSGGLPQFLISSADSFFQTVTLKASQYVSTFLTRLASSLPGFIFSLFVTVITGCYIAKDFDGIKENLNFALKPQYLRFLKKIRRITLNNVFKIIKSYLFLALIAFIELTAGFLILRIDGAVRIAFITAIIDMLPVLGCGTVLVPWAIINAFSGNYVRAVGLLVIYAVVLIVRNISEPKILGKQVGLHPMLTLISIFLGLKIFGFWGLLIVPLIVTVGYHYLSEKYSYGVTEENL